MIEGERSFCGYARGAGVDVEDVLVRDEDEEVERLKVKFDKRLSNCAEALVLSKQEVEDSLYQLKRCVISLSFLFALDLDDGSHMALLGLPSCPIVGFVRVLVMGLPLWKGRLKVGDFKISL
ncbi:uncharacterized protein ColSpa_11425 [Colletotrichum spaethianum]|uniref:Uncharacterized protein n=1 Tax=Colletotrichum spaethianum TaxID=700344 RepID=A0AA37PFG7_9PEZI|nr:uncharacterized protein ColSpa_11425 [Colletotrichum spaethianum]GKT51244.1 hypothetical protein ColSpa_11425 [Colletotrichum spaethianum]